jgi:hypothetical protein
MVYAQVYNQDGPQVKNFGVQSIQIDVATIPGIPHTQALPIMCPSQAESLESTLIV